MGPWSDRAWGSPRSLAIWALRLGCARHWPCVPAGASPGCGRRPRCNRASSGHVGTLPYGKHQPPRARCSRSLARGLVPSLPISLVAKRGGLCRLWWQQHFQSNGALQSPPSSNVLPGRRTPALCHAQGALLGPRCRPACGQGPSLAPGTSTEGAGGASRGLGDIRDLCTSL